MFLDDLTIKSNGIPVLKRDEIDTLAERILGQTMPKVLKTPIPVDIERFAEFDMGLDLAYYHLSHCGLYLGMFVFNDTDRIPIYRPENEQAEYLSVRANTVIIDPQLLLDRFPYRYRFTMMHECAHAILHQKYFSYNPDQITFFEQVPMIQCREAKHEAKLNHNWGDIEIMEWQANALAAALLMPRVTVKSLIEESDYFGVLKTPELLTHIVQRKFIVSEPAARYRLKQLGLI